MSFSLFISTFTIHASFEFTYLYTPKLKLILIRTVVDAIESTIKIIVGICICLERGACV